MNSFNAIGRVGKDAQTRFTQGGEPVTGWSLAVDSGYGDKKQTLWLDCSLWGKRGEKVAEYITKGSQLGVSGELGSREHDGKTYLTLRVGEVSLIGGKPESGRQPARNAPVDDGSDVPF
jgi:single-strand DNA-binding protein